MYLFLEVITLLNFTIGELSWRFAVQSHPRFPQAAGEPPRAVALRSLTVAFPPAGVSGGFGLLRVKPDILFFEFRCC